MRRCQADMVRGMSRHDRRAADERYRVRPASWWVVRGKRAHLFWCGSLLDVEPAPAEAPSLVYIDPPWCNELPWNSFWLDVYRGAVELAAGAPIFCESSEAAADDVASLLRGEVVTRWGMMYRRHSSVLHYGGPPLPDGFDPTGVDDDRDTVGTILQAFGDGDVILDPYAGQGMTAFAAERRGWSSINIEPNPRQVSTALTRLSRLVGSEPCELS